MQDVINKCLGLVNQFSQLAVAPGSLARANNAVNLREHVIEDRRGYKVEAELVNDIKQVIPYQNKILAHHGNVISYGINGSYADYAGTYSEPTGSKIRYEEAAGNLYFTTDKGIKVFTDASGTQARSAGTPRSLDPSYALNAAGTGFLSSGNQCAYRVTIRRTDANANVFEGYPSQRLWVVNASGTAKNADLVVYLPTEVILGDVIRFFRTAQVTGTASDIAGDEMGLVYQYAVLSTDISNGYVTFTDSITDVLRGETLYTSPSQQGIIQANDRPPLAKDIALFRSSFMFYANTSTKQRLFLTLVGAGSLSGKTVTLGGVTYNFGASEIISGGGAPQVLVSATGIAAVDIDLTARSLIRVINRYAGNTTAYAYYLTGPDDLPGQILIEEKGIGAAAFTIQASDTAISSMFFPAPPVSPATNPQSTSSNTIQKNGLYYAKEQQNEHVPTLNYILVGPANKEILRIAPLRESLIIIKEEGVYRLSGENPQSFTVTPLDLTVFCKAPDSVAVLSNQVMMLSNQGVVAVSETGVQVMSREIEPSLKPLLAKTNLASFTSAVGYESDRQYLLSTITSTSETEASQTLVYNVFTRTWMRWTYAIGSGCLDPQTDKMYFSKNGRSSLYIERKSFLDDDYADPEVNIAITAIDYVRKTVSFTIVGAIPDVGWIIQQGSNSIGISSLATVDTTYIASMDSEIPVDWMVGAAIILPSVGMDIEWNAWTANSPANLKQVRAAKVLTDNTAGANTVTALFGTFKTNFDEELESVPISQGSQAWGTGPWGNFSWGGGSDSYGYTTWVPRNKQYCTRLSFGVRHKKALEKISIAGCGFDYEMSSDRIGR